MEQTIYVVMGSTGEYSDRSEWPVAAYTDVEDAQKHVTEASRVAKEMEATRASRFTAVEGINAWDPEMSMDYTGTSYFYYDVLLRTKADPFFDFETA